MKWFLLGVLTSAAISGTVEECEDKILTSEGIVELHKGSKKYDKLVFATNRDIVRTCEGVDIRDVMIEVRRSLSEARNNFQMPLEKPKKKETIKYIMMNDVSKEGICRLLITENDDVVNKTCLKETDSKDTTLYCTPNKKMCLSKEEIIYRLRKD